MFHKRDVTLGKLKLKVKGVVGRTKKNGHLLKRHPLFPELKDPVGDKTALVRLVPGLVKGGFPSPFKPGEKAFGVFLLSVLDDGVGKVQNGLAGTVVLLELDDPGPGKEFGKLKDVSEIRPAEGVNRLGVVPHHHDVLVVFGHEADDLGLEGVGVLVFVHHDEGEAAPHLPAHLGEGLEHPVPVNEEVVVVHELVFLLVAVVVLKEAG